MTRLCRKYVSNHRSRGSVWTGGDLTSDSDAESVLDEAHLTDDVSLG